MGSKAAALLHKVLMPCLAPEEKARRGAGGLNRPCARLSGTHPRSKVRCLLGKKPIASSQGAPKASPNMLRILIADDHDVIRSGLRSAIESQGNWEVVAEAGDGKEAITKAIETKPDIAVLDYSMPLINGAEATRQIRNRLPKTEVLIFTIHDDEMLVRELLSAGARGYLLKSDCSYQLIDAIGALAVHEPFFSAKVSDVLLHSFLTRPSRKGLVLNDREKHIVRLIAEGHTNKEIAGLLNVNDHVVETHRSAIMRKLDLSSSAGIVRYAVRNGLVGV
jgi:DNA-binding NarL/FixJ family response regulator